MNPVKRIHILILSLVLAAAAVAGLVAAVRTVHLGAASQSSSQLSTAQLAQRNRQLKRIEASLRAQTLALTKPHARAAATQPVIYVRPKPIVHVIHRPHADDGGGEGGGFDD